MRFCRVIFYSRRVCVAMNRKNRFLRRCKSKYEWYPIMGEFKKLLLKSHLRFRNVSNKKRAQLLLDTSFIDDLLKRAEQKARENAQETLDMIEK